MDGEARRRAPGLGAPPAGQVHEGQALTEATRFALWFTAWCSGEVSLDEARDVIVAGDAAHDVVGLEGPDDSLPLILALGRLRAEGATGAGLALPVPGDPLGLGGPPTFNAEALEAGEAVVLVGADLGLVPTRVGRGVVWRCLTAQSRRQVPALADGDTELRRVLPAVADRLAALEVARWAPAVADGLAEQLAALRHPAPLALPPGTDPRVARTTALALRCRAVVELAAVDDGGAVSAAEADNRRDALRDLDRAARRALVAALSAEVRG